MASEIFQGVDMKRLTILSAVACTLGLATLAGCPGKSSPDAGDAGDEVYVDPIIDISGTVQLNPAVKAWYQATGLTPPAVGGTALYAEEPLRASQNDPNSRKLCGCDAGLCDCIITGLPADGTYKFSQVNTRPIILGLIGVLYDKRPIYGEAIDGGTDGGAPDGSCDGGAAGTDGGLIPAGYAQFARSLSTLAEGKPKVNLTNVPVYGVTFDYVNYLDQITGACGDKELLNVGILFGLVVDANNNPIAGATVKDKTGQVKDTDFIYFNNPVTAKKPASDPTTGTNGIFLVANAFEVWRGGAKDPTYPSHLGGSGGDTVFQLVMKPK
jgi:hypothetical protein